MRTKHFYWIALAAAVLAGCSSDDEVMGRQQTGLPEDGVIRIATQVNRLVETRVPMTTPYKGTSLGLYIKPATIAGWDNAADKYTYPNVLFKTTDNGSTWTQTSFPSMLWKGSDVEYEYYAYAPADTKAVDDKVPYNLSDQSGKSEEQNDLLWTFGSGKASDLVTDQKLSITFGHIFCKVAVEIDLGNEFYRDGTTDNPVESISISTTHLSGSMNVLDGTLTANATGTLTFGTGGTHIAGDATVNGSYITPYLFYAPGSENFTVTITSTSGRTFVYTHPQACTFGQGNQYLIKLKMGKEVLQRNRITVEDWKSGITPNDGKLETV